MKYISPFLIRDIIESALDRNYQEMADLIEISGKYDLEREDEDLLVKQVRRCQENINNIQEVANKYWSHVRSKQVQG